MNIIEIHDDLLRRVTLAEGDLTILRNLVKSLEITVNNLNRRINDLEQNPSIIKGNKISSGTVE